MAWYNGHPDYADHEFDLTATRAVVIGNGNVAVDVARMLVLDPDEMAATDTADHAIAPLGAASVHEVIVLGRRGPAQAAFTTPELRELGELTRADIIVDPADMELDAFSANWLEDRGRPDQQAQRRAPARVRAARAARPRAPRRAALPALAGGDPRRRRGRRGHRHPDRQEPDRGRPRRAHRRGGGHRLRPRDPLDRLPRPPLAGIPFDERTGLISNLGGRVLDRERRHEVGEYVVGWVKRGPSGVIGTNKKDATDTVARILEDREAGKLNAPKDPDPASAARSSWPQRCPSVVTWEGWHAIDAHETGLGEPQGRPRVKLVRTGEMLDIASGALSQ